MDRPVKGIIFNIKRFSVHDGPGIRTSIFLKGCPLRCIWCHNPEGIDPGITVWYNRNICIGCGSCIAGCPDKALAFHSPEDKYIETDRNLCRLAGACVKACPTGAIEFTGRICSAAKVMEEIRKDKIFYFNSGGGITLTGGEPLMQPSFSLEILKAGKLEGIGTAVETCLFCEREVLEDLMDYVDLFLVDMKIFDSSKHEHYTGESNYIIKENLKFLAAAGNQIIVRVPLIKDLTDTPGNLKSILDFVHGLDPEISVEFLNYNPLARDKYRRLSIPYSLE